MSRSYQTKEKSSLQPSKLMSLHLRDRRQSLLALQWFFYSAIACIWPFLYSTHPSDIGLNTIERNSTHLISAALRVLLIGPCIYWKVHVLLLRKARICLCILLIFTLVIHLALLAVPRTQRLARQPKVTLNCSLPDVQIRVEWCDRNPRRCPPMGSQSLALAFPSSGGSFSTFSLGTCRTICAQQISWSFVQPTSAGSTPGDPSAVRFCFQRRAGITSPQTRCLNFDSHLPMKENSSHISQLQFHSKSNAWISVNSIPQPASTLHPYASCVYTQSQPVFLQGDSFERLTCFPLKKPEPLCESICTVNLLQKAQYASAGTWQQTLPIHPTLCEHVHGDPLRTFISYTIIRSLADVFLLLSHLAISTLHTYHTCNLALLHAGRKRASCMGSVALIWCTLSGLALHAYSSAQGPPAYEVSFVLFAGLICVACALCCTLPIAPAPIELQSALVNRHASNLYLTEQAMYASDSDVRRTRSCTHLPQTAPIKKTGWIRSPSALLFLTSLQSAAISWTNVQLPVYLLSIGHTRPWLALAEASGWCLYAAFACAGGTCLATLGKRTWIALALVFDVLLFCAVSATYESSLWQLLAFGCMRAFTFPLFTMAASALLHAQRPRSRMKHVHIQVLFQYTMFALGPLLCSLIMLLLHLPRFQLFVQINTPSWLRLRSADLLATQLPQLMLLDQLNALRLTARLIALCIVVCAFTYVTGKALWVTCVYLWQYEEPVKRQKSQRKENNENLSKLNGEQRALLKTPSNINSSLLERIKMIDD